MLRLRRLRRLLWLLRLRWLLRRLGVRGLQLLWLLCPVLLYWVSRVWLLAHRGAMHDDPIIFALRDRQSWLVVVALALIGFAAGPK